MPPEPLHGFEIRPITEPELDNVVDEWLPAEGWRPGRRDAHVARRADPEGLIAGVLHGEAVGLISTLRYTANYAFVGLFFVEKQYRGRGLGSRIWSAAMARLQGCAAIGLDATPAKVAMYEQTGFVAAHRTLRFELRADKEVAPSLEHGVVHELLDDELVAYDAEVFPVRRNAFISSWWKEPCNMRRAMKREGQVLGFGVMRPCPGGFRIGPLFADAPHVAWTIFASLQVCFSLPTHILYRARCCSRQADPLASTGGGAERHSGLRRRPRIQCWCGCTLPRSRGSRQ